MTSIVQLKDQCDKQFLDIRGDLIRLSQTAEMQQNDVTSIRSDIGKMRGDIGDILTKVHADFSALSDSLQMTQHVALEGMNEVVNKARITFAEQQGKLDEQQGKLDVHHRTLVEEHEKYERMQNDVHELHRRTETSVIELQTWIRKVEAKVDQGGGGPGGLVEPGKMEQIQHDLRDLYQKTENSIIDLQKKCHALDARVN